MQILITVAVLALVVGVLFLLGSRQRGDSKNARGVRPRPSAAGAPQPVKKSLLVQQARPGPGVSDRLCCRRGRRPGSRSHSSACRGPRSRPPWRSSSMSQSMNATDVTIEPAGGRQQGPRRGGAAPRLVPGRSVTFADKATVLIPPTVDAPKSDRARPSAARPRRRGRDGLSVPWHDEALTDGGTSPAVAVLLSDGTRERGFADGCGRRAASIGVPVYGGAGKTSPGRRRRPAVPDRERHRRHDLDGRVRRGLDDDLSGPGVGALHAAADQQLRATLRDHRGVAGDGRRGGRDHPVAAAAVLRVTPRRAS